MNKSEQINELAKALSAFQGEVSNPKKTANNPHFDRKYTPLDELVNVVKPVLQKHGLSYIQNTWSEGENVVIQTLLMHESGQWLESSPLTLPGHQMLKGGGRAWNAQGAGSAITYGRRYQLSSVLGVASEEDDDGNQVSGGDEARGSRSSGQQGGHTGPAAMISQKQIGAIKGKVKKIAELSDRTIEEVEIKLKETMQYSATNELTSQRASKVLDKLEEWVRLYEGQRHSG